jgi:hypothetical protein
MASVTPAPASTRCLVMIVHRRFRELVALDLPPPVFLGLCAYLYVLLGWGWPVPGGRLDSFICAYQTYRHLPPHRVSYHAWLEANPYPDGQHPPLLDLATLGAIVDENPYTFAFVRESLHIIARQRGLVPPDPAPPVDVDPQGDRAPDRGDPGPSLGALSVHDTQDQPLELDDLQVWHDEKALRKSLDLHDRAELFQWIQQDWVFDIYEEYCVAVLDHWRANRGGDVQPTIRGSAARFIISTGIRALAHDTHHLQDRDRTHWTQDEHDIRFIARLVSEGRQPERWWERQRSPVHTATLCTTAYRLLCWLRHVHRLVATRGVGGQLQRAVDCKWYTQLQEERARRADERRRVQSKAV